MDLIYALLVRKEEQKRLKRNRKPLMLFWNNELNNSVNKGKFYEKLKRYLQCIISFF